MRRENGITLMQVRQPIPVENPESNADGWSIQPGGATDTKNNLRKITQNTGASKIPDHWVNNASQTDVKQKTPEWRNLMLLISSHFGEDGRKLAKAVSSNNTAWPDDTDEILDDCYDEFLKHADPSKSSLKAVIRALEEAGISLRKFPTPPEGAFWKVEAGYNDKTGEPTEKLVIEKADIYRRCLPHLGFSVNNCGEYVREIAPSLVTFDIKILDIKQALIDFIEKQDEALHSPLHEFIIKRGNMPDKASLEFLEMKELPFLRSNSKTVYMYFQDGVLATDRKTHERTLKDYSELDGHYVSKEAIIPVNYADLSPERAENAMFGDFLKRILDDYESGLIVIGYLMDDYKDETNSKAIIITDYEATLDGNSHGGTGKDLLVKGIVQVVRLFTKISGKRFNPANPFNLQLFKKGSKLLWIEDLNKTTKEESLFPMITGDLEVERKYHDAITILAFVVPKIVISTNYALPSTGSSSKRRTYLLELKPYFDADHTPFDEYGIRFYTEWSEEEWLNFYSLLTFKALDTYLDKGLVCVPYSDGYRRKQVIQQTSEDFFDFCESVDLNDSQPEDDIANLRNNFLKDCGEASAKTINSNVSIFSVWLRLYVEVYLLLKLKTRKSNKKTLYVIERADSI